MTIAPRDSRVTVAARISAAALFGVVPLLWTAAEFIRWMDRPGLGFDLRFAFLPAARDILDGISPYPTPGDPALAQGVAYVYPPLVAMVFVPALALPLSAAVALGVAGTFALVVVTLAILGVRDWRCYTLALAWGPVANSAENAALSMGLALLLALAWRHRHRHLLSGALLGLAITSKLFLWPVALWPFVLRRSRTVIAMATVGLVAVFGSWAVIGFAGLGDYFGLLRELSRLEEQDSYSLSGTLLEAGLPTVPARLLAAAVVLGLVAAAVRFGTRRDDARAFSAGILAALAATPILWQHYLVVLLVVAATTAPRFGVVWVAPVLTWLGPFTGNGATWQALVVVAVAVSVGGICLARPASVLRGEGTGRPAPAG